eukprot:TRINITY_DN14881_c0_g1_i1.p3 TRINITY_DN14881_c0_g1~~TRINITY_DN14881_c0_g1_i1.p3  ORF type:complete len:201 (+),score=38.73 TRINITY_DN14881_c0_g1_i1:803-1405(+)
MIDQTFKNDGGIGGYFNKSAEDYIGWTFDGKAIFDFLFNFVIVILVTEIISGIIIDTFAVLREEEEKKKNDFENYCFICGIDRDTLDKKSDNKKGFQYHISREHNMWNYLFYISYLKDKTKTEYTGFESYVADKLKNDDISWFPINRSLSLSQKDEQAENEKQKKEKAESFESINQRILHVEKKFDNLTELLVNSFKKNH